MSERQRAPSPGRPLSRRGGRTCRRRCGHASRRNSARTRKPLPRADPAVSPRTRAFILRVERAVLAVNLIGGLYAGWPILVPWLLARGAAFPANVLHFFYGLACHQLPVRSFYAFGNKMCLRDLQRCLLLRAALPARVVPDPPIALTLDVPPLAADGARRRHAALRPARGQLGTARDQTGTLFALSCVWVALPHFARAFGEMRRDLENRFRRVALATTPAR